MIEQEGAFREMIHSVAEYAISCYAREILSVESLMEQIILEWDSRRVGDDQPSRELLIRIAQRICSRKLCAAWRSPQPGLRNCAFDNLRRYLASSLQHTGYATPLQEYENAAEDVLHQTLEDLHLALISRTSAGPDDPAAFLKWTQTILIRHARVFLQTRKRDPCLSLDAKLETFVEQFVDQQNPDPQEHILLQELQQALKDAILSLRNWRYRQVLLCTYLVGMDEQELAYCWQVQVQEIYMWRHRALKALRSKPEIIQKLRALRE